MTPLLLALSLALTSTRPATAPAAVERLPGGRFGDVDVVRPAKEPLRVVLLLGRDGGADPEGRALAAGLAHDGALVLGISTPRWIRSARHERCAYPAGDLEVLAQSVQQRLGLRSYLRPILVGEGSGAAVAIAALAQAPAGTFLGAVSLAGRPALEPPLTFCRGSASSRPGASVGTDLPARDPAALRAAVAALETRARAAAPAAPASAPAVADLPLVEVAATAAGPDAFALLVTGDGGWAGIDRALAAAVAAKGVPVIGLDSLRYFWTRRTPQSFASDLGRIIEHYAVALGRSDVALIGYSRGADVLPAAAALLAGAPRARVKVVALLGPGRSAEFELRLTDFLSRGSGGRPILPDVELLAGTPVLCIYGREEEESLCPLLRTRPGARLVELGGGHHFGGDYAAVAREVIRTLEGVAPGR